MKEIEVQNLARHCNEDLILAILGTGMKHGYQLALEIERRSGSYFKFNHGTLYPILHKLEKDGVIRGAWRKEGSQRKRKCYTLTKKGRRYARAQLEAWKRFYDSFFEIMSTIGK
jgi:DNA-binding PadR family transcriptional regulator